jgi:hypothetical protein
LGEVFVRVQGAMRVVRHARRRGEAAIVATTRLPYPKPSTAIV